jgi:enoyl-CoA hydratase
VPAKEAFEIGLVNRLVPPGASREAAERLAAELSAFPQACLRNDRMSLLEAEGRPEDEAIAVEYRHGIGSLAEAAEGAARFADGRGRHGDFTDI